VRRIVLDDGHPELHASEAVIEQATAAVSGATAVVSIGAERSPTSARSPRPPTGGVPLGGRADRGTRWTASPTTSRCCCATG
jgi:hypothetical protein